MDLSGRTVDSVRLSATGGARFADLESLERARCPEGRCLYVADVGDNEERRSDVAIHRLLEPAVEDGRIPAPGAEPDPRRNGGIAGQGRDEVVPTQILPIRFPDGPTDVEAMFVLPGEGIHLVSKGRSRPVTVYRYPLPLRPGEQVTLEAVQSLTPEPPLLPAYVTGAATSPDGQTVAIRTYESLEFYRVDHGRLIARPDARVVLRSLREAQGEAVAFLPDGRIVLTSEAGPLGRRGGLVVLRCPAA